MEIFKNFGLEPQFFFAQVVNFLILAYVFKRYLYKPVLKVLKDRENKIRTGLEEAEGAHLALEKAKEDREKIIKEATRDAEEIIQETRQNALSLKEELTIQARRDAEKIIADASDQAKIEIEKARLEARNISLDLSRKVLGRVLQELFTKNEKEEIMKRNIKILSKYEE